MVSSITSQCPSFSKSGLSNVLAISPPVTSDNCSMPSKSVFYDENAFLSQERIERFRIVVDQLSVNEAVDVMCCNSLYFGFHFFLIIVVSTWNQRGKRNWITFSACLSSASFSVSSTLTRAPKILILSVSMADEMKLRKRTDRRRESDIQVFAKVFQSFRWIHSSRMKPEKKRSRKNEIYREKYKPLSRSFSRSCAPFNLARKYSKRASYRRWYRRLTSSRCRRISSFSTSSASPSLAQTPFHPIRLCP